MTLYWFRGISNNLRGSVRFRLPLSLEISQKPRLKEIFLISREYCPVPPLLHVVSAAHCYLVLILTKLRKHPLCSYGRNLYLLISTNYLVFILGTVLCMLPRQTSYFKFPQGFDNVLSTLLPSLKVLPPNEEIKQGNLTKQTSI